MKALSLMSMGLVILTSLISSVAMAEDTFTSPAADFDQKSFYIRGATPNYNRSATVENLAARLNRLEKQHQEIERLFQKYRQQSMSR